MKQHVDILLFSVLRDKLGAETIKIEAEFPVSCGELLESAARAYPVLSPWTKAIRVAVNHEYVTDDHPVLSGDEIAFITAVSGG